MTGAHSKPEPGRLEERTVPELQSLQTPGKSAKCARITPSFLDTHQNRLLSYAVFQFPVYSFLKH